VINILPNFAQEAELRRQHAQARADRLPPHILDVLRTTHAAHYPELLNMKKHDVMSEIAALEATLPAAGPTAHLPYAAGPEDLGRVMGRKSGFIIGPHYSAPPRVRQAKADLEALGS
jgi:hypothetical protein